MSKYRNRMETALDRKMIYEFSLKGISQSIILQELHKLHKESGRTHVPLTIKSISADLKSFKKELLKSDVFNLPFELKKKYDEYELMKKELWRIISEGIKATSVTGKQETKVIKGKKVKVVVPQLQQDTIYKNGGLAPYFAQLRGVIKDQSKLIGLIDSGSLTIKILNQTFGIKDDKDKTNESGGQFDNLPYHKQEAIMEIIMRKDNDFEDVEVVGQ